MTTIDVVGGLYGETCRFPAVEEIYGSGGRAAIALAEACHEVRWHYYCPRYLQREARNALPSPRIAHFPHDSAVQVDFTYLHPLSRPVVRPGEIAASPPIKIDADLVLRFGMMEGDAIVTAQACVFDPQSLEPSSFAENGSTAESLAIVLNHEEVLQYAKANDEEQAVQRMVTGSARSVVVVKAGTAGCRVYESGRLTATVPPYWSERVYKIGTGDIFSAAFAAAWLVDGLEAAASADHASRCVARYAETRNPSAAVSGSDRDRQRAPVGGKGVVHISGSTSTMSTLWLMDEAREALLDLGVAVSANYRRFEKSPAGVLGTIGSSGSERPMAVLALLEPVDPTVLLEVKMALGLGVPVVAYARGDAATVLTASCSPMLEVCDDFATALYHATWAARL